MQNKKRNSLKKKKFAIILCMATVLSFASCGLGGGGETTEPTTISPEEVMSNAVLQYPSKNDEFRYVIYDTYIAISEYIGPGGAVKIPSEIENLPVYAINDRAFKEYSSRELERDDTLVQDGRVTSVTVSENIVTFGEEAFRNCEALTSINIPSTAREIKNGCFDGCVGLNTITFANGVKSIGDTAFYDTKSLREVVLPESLITIGENCFEESGIVSLSIPSNLLIIPTEFCLNCEHLTNVKINELIVKEEATEDKDSKKTAKEEASGRTINGSAFANCPNLTYVWIPGSFVQISETAFTDSQDKLWFCSYTQSTAAVYASQYLIDFKLITEEDFIKLYNESTSNTIKTIESETTTVAPKTK